MKKNNREKILSTARSLFLKNGYNGISIRAIAAEAKLTTGAIYFHFKNKKDIYKTICQEAIDILINNFKESINKKKTPNQKLISTFDSYINFFYEHNDYYNILMEYKSKYDSEKETDKDEIALKMKEMTKVTEQVIELGINENKFRNIDPLMLSIFLASVAEGMLQYKKFGLFESMGISDKDFRKFMADIVGEGIIKK